MPPPLANRFVHLNMEVSFEDWKGWAYEQGIDSSIIAFLHYDNAKLFDFDPSKNQKSFPTPRSWEYVDKILSSGMDATLLMDIISGAVGSESATAFMSFRKVMHKLPDIDKLLANEELEVEHDSQVLFALIAGIISNIKQNSTKEKIDNALKFSLTLPKEFSVMLVKDMQQNKINVEASSVWDDWVEEFAYLLV
jgi:hypothetical protein